MLCAPPTEKKDRATPNHINDTKTLQIIMLEYKSIDGFLLLLAVEVLGFSAVPYRLSNHKSRWALAQKLTGKFVRDRKTLHCYVLSALKLW